MSHRNRKGSKAFYDWMKINSVANKRDLQLINYALLEIRKSPFIFEEKKPSIRFKPMDFSRDSGKIGCDYNGIKKSLYEINNFIKIDQNNFIKSCRYNDLDRICEFEFNLNAYDLLRLGNSCLFNSNQFKHSFHLRTEVALRLYNYVGKWRYSKKTKFIFIRDLKNLLGVDKAAYTRFERFRSCIIDQSLEEINVYTGNKVDYELRKTGNKVESIRFIHTK
jgi:hypothetical protein